jgi:predicted cupin superfamily sugar epimerase
MRGRSLPRYFPTPYTLTNLYLIPPSLDDCRPKNIGLYLLWHKDTGGSMQELIEKYKLAPHPEGGYYAVVYESFQRVKSALVNKKRKAVTHIYFLLIEGQVSLFHKVIHDEIWNFYEGDPLKLIKFAGVDIEEDIIGSGCSDYVSIVEGGVFQAAVSTGAYSLVGCTVAPGFEFADFSFLRDEPESKDNLLKNFPHYRKFV